VPTTSNTSGAVGFLADARRMNVAVTRARRHVALVCDSDTVTQDPFLGRLVEYVQERGSYESAAELLPGQHC
jgi:superfamily I DNA and/or RNA helicase